jgi:hypothetical protein
MSEYGNGSDWDDSAENLLALEAEIPVLSALREFAQEAVRAPWFASLGEPFGEETKQIARAYLDTLGYPHADAIAVLNWDDALDASETLDMNTQAWEAEEQLRAALLDQALRGVSEEGLGVMLSHLAAQLSDVLRQMAEEALYMADELPDHIIDLAVGAGQQAAHGAALVLAAAAVEAAQNDDMEMGEDALNHPLMLKYRLFEYGHWPLALTGQTLNLF